MSEPVLYKVDPEFAANSHIDLEGYEEMYRRSVADPESFWAEQAEKYVDWFTPWHTVSQWDYHTGEIRWFDGATLNVAYNCIDRHLATRGEQTAIIWESDDPSIDRKLSFNELHQEVCRHFKPRAFNTRRARSKVLVTGCGGFQRRGHDHYGL